MAVDHVVPFFCLIACLLLLITLPWHFRSGNTAVIMFIGWLFLANFVTAVNAFIWWDTAENMAPIWCDVTTKFTSLWAMGVACSNLLIARRLESIASTRSVVDSKYSKRRCLALELIFGITIPVVYTVLSIVYQGHRFDIFGGMGCQPAIYVSVPYIVLGIIPPLLLQAATLLLSLMSLRHFLVRQKQFNAVLSSSGTTLTKTRYLRLMLLCLVEVLFALPITLYQQIAFLTRFTDALQPYTSWDDVHYGFGTVITIDSSYFDTAEGARMFHVVALARWIAPIGAFICFGFFGFGADAVEEYRRWGHGILRLVDHAPGRQAKSKMDVPRAELPRLEMHSSRRSKDFDELKLQPITPASASSANTQYEKGVNVHVERYVA